MKYNISMSPEYLISLGQLGPLVQKVVVYFRRPNEQQRRPAVVVSQEYAHNPYYLAISDALRDVASWTVSHNWDDGIDAGDTDLDHAVNGLRGAVRNAKGKVTKDDLSAFGLQAIDELRWQLPILRDFTDESPVLGKWKGIMEAHYHRVLQDLEDGLL